MAFDIKGLGGIKGADKAKAKARTGSVGGPSFADILEDAQNAENTESNAGLNGGMDGGFGGGYVPFEEDVPKDAPGQAREMMKTLKSLAGDALSGTPTATADRLEALAASVDESTLTAAQKQALDEVRTRAAVEVAKLKG